uniref:Uncharacterized protein n=1 Tax=viral metagenome TaxID=1070528 RepID=A0A6C0EI89_9ZZZZ
MPGLEPMILNKTVLFNIVFLIYRDIENNNYIVINDSQSNIIQYD